MSKNNISITASTSKNTTAEVPKLNEEQKNEHNDKRNLALPPEYDEHDSRWTLKYREPATGLVELMEHSGVYVNADKLAECKKLSNDCLTFARRLLTEIFTVSALRTCSLSAATATDFNINVDHGRPELDTHATIILLKFVAEIGQEMNWIVTEYQCILNSILQKTELMRRIERKEQEEEDADEFLKNGQNRYSSSTLKYTKPAPGLVELIENSDVYVNADKLAECKRLSNACEVFARRLLTEIFTVSALCTCSLSAATANGLDIDADNDGPELDTHAIIILLKFVAETGLEMNWPVTEYQSILNSILQTMEEMRGIEKQKKEADERLKRSQKRHSRSTLKYAKPAPGLVELIKNSGVYVNADQLAECKRLSNDCETLGRMLLTEVYNKEALVHYSLSDKNHKIYTLPAHAYPKFRTYCLELDAYAEIILLNFVDEYCLEKGWKMLDFQIIRMGMIHKILELKKEFRLQSIPRVAVIEIKKAVQRMQLESAGVSWNTQCRFVLPPEYDENDSSWTLKYRETAPGLVELITCSGVYVNAERLAECKRLANDRATLAQKLLTEIFTPSALSVCVFERVYYRGNNFRPVLNPQAARRFLEFVVKCKEMRKFTRQDVDSVAASICHEMMVTKKRTQI